jgi:hypothetical protein
MTGNSPEFVATSFPSGGHGLGVTVHHVPVRFAIKGADMSFAVEQPVDFIVHYSQRSGKA